MTKIDSLRTGFAGLSVVKTGLGVLALTLVGTVTQAATLSLFQSQTGVFGASQEGQGGAFVGLIQRDAMSTFTTKTHDDRASTMLFDQFDASLGTLTDVSVKYVITKAGRNSIAHLRRNCSDNLGNCSVVVEANTLVSYGVDIEPVANQGTGSNPPLNVGLSAFRSLKDDDGEKSFAVEDSAARTYSGVDAAGFIGSGTFDIQPIVQTETRTAVSCQASFFAIDLTDCNGDVLVRYNINYRVEVLYEYEENVVAPSPVPLPAGLPMLAFGLLGLGTLARRRRGRSA